MRTEDKNEIYQAFKSYKRMNHNSLKVLNKVGLTITTSGGNHFKIENKATGKCVFIPVSPSDRRSGRNAAKNICKILE